MNIKGMFTKEKFKEEGGYLEILKIAYPLVILGASYVIMLITDRMLLAWHNTLQMSASVPAGGLNFTLLSIYSVTIAFTSSLVAQYFGAGDKINCVKTAWNSFYCALFAIVCILSINMQIARHIIVNLSGHDPRLIALEMKYFYALQPSACFACLNASLFGFFSGTGRTKVIAKVNTTMCVLNMIFDYIFINGISALGIPALGILGAGLATSTCGMIGFSWVLSDFLHENQSIYPTRSKELRKFELSRVLKLIKFGFPSGLQVCLGSGGFSFCQFMIGYIGNEAITASSILVSLNSIAFAPIMGFCDATSILVGQYIGRGRKDISERVVFNVIRIVSPYVLILSLLYLICPKVLVECFNSMKSSSDSASQVIDFEEVKNIAVYLLGVAAFTNFADLLRFSSIGALRGAGDTRAILCIVGSCSVFILMPGLFVLTKVLHQGIGVVWTYFAFYLCLLATFTHWRFRSGAWKKLKIIHTKV